MLQVAEVIVQITSAAPDIISTRRSVTIVPVPILIDYCLTHPLKRCVVSCECFARKVFDNVMCDGSVAFGSKVYAVNCHGNRGCFVQRLGEGKQVDEGDASLCSHFGHHLCVSCQATIVF